MVKNKDKGSMIMGGATMIGVGVGFFLFHISPMWFVACIMIGIGLGIIVAQFASKNK